MARTISQIFSPPPASRVFAPLLNALDDDSLHVDPAVFMETIGPIFLQHFNATIPRRITKPIGSKHGDAQITYYVLSHGRHRGGPYAYRLISIDTAGKLEIIDTKRLPDESDIFGRQSFRHSGLSRLKAKQTADFKNRRDSLVKYGGAYADMAADLNSYDGLFDAIFDKFRMLDRVFKRVRSSAEWVSDLRFIEDDETSYFKGSNSSRESVVDDMLREAEDLIGTRQEDMPKCDFIKRLLLQCLDDFDAEMGRAAKEILSEIRNGLNREVMDILAVNPSGVTTRNYALLTRSKKPEVPELWRQAARACPIILLLRDRLLRDQNLLEMAQGGFNPDHVVTYYFGVTKPQRIAYYKGLTEETVGLHNAERLRQLAYHLEKLDGIYPDPQCPEDWNNLATLVDAANHIAMIVDRPSERVLRDLINTDERDPAATIYRHFSMKDRGRFASISNLIDWKERIVASVLVPKVMVESRKRELSIPLQHIFYIVAGETTPRRDLNNSLSRPQRRAIMQFREGHSFLGQFFDGVAASTLLDTAHEFATHKLDWDEAVRDRILSNRLFENGIQYPFPSLPEIRQLDDLDTVTPIRGMDELLKECLDLKDFSVMNYGHRVAREAIHFVAVRGPDARTRAIACLEEPKGPFEPWTIRDIVTDPASHRNASARVLVERYITHEDFLKNADVEKLRTARATLRESLVSRVHDRELMGFKVGNISERRGVLEALNPYIKVAGGWSIDRDGCIDAPKLNAMVDALLRGVGPYYPKFAA